MLFDLHQFGKFANCKLKCKDADTFLFTKNFVTIGQWLLFDKFEAILI